MGGSNVLVDHLRGLSRMLIMPCDELWCYDDACHGYLEVDDERRT